MSIRKNDKGIAHPLFIVLALVVIAAVGAAGYMVYKNQKGEVVTSAHANASDAEKAAIKTAEKSCNDVLKDKTLCIFAANYAMPKAYEMTITTKDSTATTASVISEDGKGNTKTVISSNGKETAASILLNKITYIKDESSGNWIKYPSSSDPDSSINSTASSEMVFDKNDWTEGNTTTYKALGQEACGSLTCYKYQTMDTKSPDATQYFWFDNKDYLMRRYTRTDKSTSTDMSINYTSPTITTPSPVVDYSSSSGSVDTSAWLKQLQSMSGN